MQSGTVLPLPSRPVLSTSSVQCIQQPLSQNSQNSRVAALIAVPLAWGSYGPAVKLAYELPHVPPAPVLQAAFQFVSFSGLIIAGLLNAQRQGAATVDATDDTAADSGGLNIDASTARAGLELGLWLFLGQALQLQGLQRTDAAKAGFFVQLTTVLVPLVESLLLGRTLAPRLWAACTCATAGIAVISAEVLLQSGSDGASSTLIGDALVACSALLYTTHVIRLGEYAGRLEALPLARAKAGAQLLYGFGTIAALSLSGGMAAGEWAGGVTSPELRTLALVALWNGLIPSAFTTWAQTYGQAAVPPSAANVLYSFQPVWNAGLAVLILGEQVDATELAGGALIVLGAILAADANGGGADADDDGAKSSSE